MGDAPLHKAAWKGFADVTRALVEANADVSIVNADKKKPIDLARSHDVRKTLFVNTGDFGTCRSHRFIDERKSKDARIHSLTHSFVHSSFTCGRAYLQRTMPMTRTKRTMTRIKSSRSSFDRCHCRVTSAAASASEREIEIPPLSLWTSSITRMLLPHVYCTHPRSPSLHFLAPAHSLSCLPHPSNPINHQSISLSLSLHTRSHSPIQQSRSLSRWQ